jgi:hypothetical protein
MIYGKIKEPYWNDKPVAVIGGGPSLKDFDLEQIRGAHVLALRGAIFDVPWADAGYGFGVQCFAQVRDRLARLRTVYWAVRDHDQVERPPKNITFLKRLDGWNLSDDPGEIYGGNAGFGAMQICIHKRAKEIVLFGFDYEQDREHWARWAEHFSIYVPYLNAHKIHVTNACPTSAIRCFQKVALRDGAAMLREKIAA